jgi:hypothetical protein
MFGYSRTRNEVFTLAKKLPQRADPKIKVDTKLLQLLEVTAEQWRQVKRLQGLFPALYLKWRYGSPDTFILLAFVDQILSYIEWIVPARKIKSRYSFVSEDSYSIISCLTEPRFRRLGIYTSQIQKVVESDIPAKMFWIWTESTNIPSLKGISNAGGIKVGEFVQKKWFWGCISHLEYHPEESAGK